MRYTPEHIASIIGGRLTGESPHVEITQLLTDSRQVNFPEKAAFFALRGLRHNGHRYLEELYHKGVRCFVVDQPSPIFPGAAVIETTDSLLALQHLATWHRQQFQLPVIGITGSNGKTIVKEWLFQLLQPDYRIVRSPRSYNSQVGVPLSVWQIQDRHQLGIFEAGISQVGEMERLAPIIQCSVGIFTNIGEAHQEGFASLEEKLAEKLRLFSSAEVIVYNRDQPQVHQQIQQLGKRTFTWSRSDPADVMILKEKKNDFQHTEITARIGSATNSIVIPFSDPASIEDAIHCWACMTLLGINQEEIARRMRQLEPVAMRLELREGINGCTLINDTYNSDVKSLAIALHFLAQQSKKAARTLLLSDILESGQDPEILYAEVAQLLKDTRVTRFVGVGKAVERLKTLLPAEIRCKVFSDTEQLLDNIDHLDFQNEFILLKGARKFAFERIAARLSRKVHRTTLEVNLSALAHNLNAYHRTLKPGVKLMVMVKAAAYGSGSLEVARMMEFYKVDYLAVAYADEGADLRRGGINLPILVLNPEEAAFETMIRYQLEPEVYSLPQLKQLALYVPEGGAPMSVHVKLDTGMHRLGFEPAHLEELADVLKNYPQLRVQSVFSHLAASEAPEHDAFTLHQIRTFNESYEQLAQAIGYRPLRHILNTTGISRFSDHQMEMVRLGIGLYGIDNNPGMQQQLKTVLTLRATVSQIKTLAPGETVGYGRRGEVPAVTRIATISIGYADGLLRKAGNRRFDVVIDGRRAPIVGNVCMDMCMVDVTSIPGAREGSEVIIFGENPRVETLAEALQTIPYEVFTGISPRVRRVYHHE